MKMEIRCTEKQQQEQRKRNFDSSFLFFGSVVGSFAWIWNNFSAFITVRDVLDIRN